MSKALAINKKVLGLLHPDVATLTSNYAGLLKSTVRINAICNGTHDDLHTAGCSLCFFVALLRRGIPDLR